MVAFGCYYGSLVGAKKIFGDESYHEEYSLEEYYLLKEQLLSKQLKEIRVLGAEFVEGQGADIKNMKSQFKLLQEIEEKRMQEDCFKNNLKILEDTKA